MEDYGSSSVVSFTNGIRGFATLLEGLGVRGVGSNQRCAGWLRLFDGSQHDWDSLVEDGVWRGRFTLFWCWCGSFRGAGFWQ
jgi:hypothetical protein